MKSLIIYILPFFLFTPNCQKEKDTDQGIVITSETKLNIDSLKIVFSSIVDEKDINQTSKTKYLELFPSSYIQFVETFGYDNEKEIAAPLYTDSYLYIQMFFKLVHDSRNYYKKCLML